MGLSAVTQDLLIQLGIELAAMSVTLAAANSLAIALYERWRTTRRTQRATRPYQGAITWTEADTRLAAYAARIHETVGRQHAALSATGQVQAQLQNSRATQCIN